MMTTEQQMYEIVNQVQQVTAALAQEQARRVAQEAQVDNLTNQL